MRNGRRSKTKIDIDEQLSELGIGETGISSDTFFDETTDDDFLRQFEAEINSVGRNDISETNEGNGELEQEIQALLSGVANEVVANQTEENQQEDVTTEDAIEVEEQEQVQETPEVNLPIDEETGEVNLAGESGALEDLLQSDQELADISALFDTKSEVEENESSELIEAYANEQLQKSEEQNEQPQSEEIADNGTSQKKFNIIDKIKSIFRKKQESEKKENPELSPTEELARENEQILMDMEKEDQKKQKKPKKEKTKKEKNTQPKPEKIPKVKKPKEIDNTPPLPKKPVVLVVFMTASILVLVIVGTSLIGYQNNITVANEYYSNGNYSMAYQQVDGLKIKDKDKELYNKIETLAIVESEYENYQAFLAYGDEEAALDSLICAAGRSEANMPYAVNYDCVTELENLQGEVEKELKDNYNITFEEAVEIYNSSNRRSYTELLIKKMKELGIN